MRPRWLTLAAQLARFPSIRTRIVERKDGPLALGQADGIACRTMEMFNAFGFADRVAREAYWVNETTFWKPDDSEARRISRHGRIADTEDGLSEFPTSSSTRPASMTSTLKRCAMRRPALFRTTPWKWRT